VQSGLVIRERWINLVLKGEKTWEMRSQRTNIRGRVALIQQGTGLVVGTACLMDSLAPLSRESYMNHRDRHAIPESMLDEVLAARWIYPWVLSDARRLPVAVPYTHKSGAVTFVRLDDAVIEAITRQGATSRPPEKPFVSPRSGPPASVSPSPTVVCPPKAAPATASSARSQRATLGGQLFCFRPEIAQAYGRPLPDGGFLVEAGSTAMRNGSPRMKRDREVRNQLVRQGILVPDSDARLYRFSADHVFSSPSQAAGVVKDGNASGPGLWIDETTGKSLRELSS
jgi:hypothetical protein